MYDEILVTDNISIIYDVLKKMHLYNKLDEYYDICIYGLVIAAKTFEPNKGYAFTTYAYKCITNEVLRDIRQKNQNKRKANNNTISLNTTIFDDGSETGLTLESVIPSNIDIEEELIKKEQIDNLYIAISKLSKREADIISSLYGLNGFKKLNQYELSKKYNIAQSTISRIKIKGIEKLRKLLKEDNG